MLVTSLMANAALDSVQHRACVRKVGTDARKEKIQKEKEALKLMSEGPSKKTKKRLDRIGECGIWISMMPHKLHGTLLTQDEFSNIIRIRYGLRPLALCSHCDGWGKGFSIEHALSYKKGGLVTQSHVDLDVTR